MNNTDCVSLLDMSEKDISNELTEKEPPTDFGKRLKKLIDKSPYSYPQVGELCGWENSSARISNYINRPGTRYAPDDIIRLAKVLGATAGWLLFGEGADPTLKKTGIPENTIPILLWTDIINLPSVKTTDQTTFILKTQNATDKCYALRVENEAMCGKNKYFSVGEIIVVDPERKPKNRDYVIACQNESPLPIFRQYIEDGVIYLHPLNYEYNQNIVVTKHVKILGVVIAHIDLLV